VPPRLVVTVGLPGSGKSYYLTGLGVNAISSDAIRLQLADDVNDQTIHARVFETMRYLARQRLEMKRPVTYIDATSLTRKDRRQFVELAKECGAVAEALYFDVPLELCMERNAGRGRVVPPEVLKMMAAKLEPPEIEEGFDRVTVVRPE
jgi:predicted kinase